jgi:uncharacterized protein
MRNLLPRPISACLRGFCLLLMMTAGASAQAIPPLPHPARAQEGMRETNDISVSLIVSGMGCTCMRFAEDIRNVVNDIRPGGVRVLPMLGNGGFQSVNDMLFLRGVDMGTVDQDTLTLLKRKDPKTYQELSKQIHYIAKLYNSELHVLAKQDIRSLADLAGKVVNFHLRDSETHVTADNIFGMLRIPTQKVFHDTAQAIQKLMSGEIAAVIMLTGAPQAPLGRLKREDGFHFVPISEASLPDKPMDAVLEDYLPAELTAELYPNLVEPGKPVPTIANRTLLAAYNWPEDSERYARVARFVEAFFGKIDRFREAGRHQKWKEINLAAEVPGWTRFKAAQEWLNGKRVLAVKDQKPAGGELQASFKTFLDSYQASTGRRLTAPEKDGLFTEFKTFMDTRTAKRVSP